MLKKEVSYKDFNGEDVTDTLYFNLSKADLIQLRLEGGTDFGEYIEQIAATNDGPEIWKIFTKILKMSYGKKSADGKRFIKSEELFAEFMSTEAYSTLIMELLTDPDAAAEFMKGIVPQNLDEDLAKIAARNGSAPQAAPVVTEEPRRLSREEVLEMDHDELKSGLATGRYLID